MAQNQTTKIEQVAKALWRLDNLENETFSAVAPNDWDRWPETGREASLAYVEHSKNDYRDQAQVAIGIWEFLMAENKTTNIPRWRHQAAVEGLLRTLATCMAPEDADLHDFREYLEANEFGLALDELAAVVNGRGRKRE